MKRFLTNSNGVAFHTSLIDRMRATACNINILVDNGNKELQFYQYENEQWIVMASHHILQLVFFQERKEET